MTKEEDRPSMKLEVLKRKILVSGEQGQNRGDMDKQIAICGHRE